MAFIDCKAQNLKNNIEEFLKKEQSVDSEASGLPIFVVQVANLNPQGRGSNYPIEMRKNHKTEHFYVALTKPIYYLDPQSFFLIE